jgi:hypothetical protein
VSAQWSRLTEYLLTAGDSVTLTWDELDRIVDGLPASATEHQALGTATARIHELGSELGSSSTRSNEDVAPAFVGPALIRASSLSRRRDHLHRPPAILPAADGHLADLMCQGEADAAGSRSGPVRVDAVPQAALICPN